MATDKLTTLLKLSQKQGYLDACMGGRKMSLPLLLEALGVKVKLTMDERMMVQSMYKAGFDYDF
jgi:hypothetical protein